MWIFLFIHPTTAICPFPAAREQRALLLLPHLDLPELSFPKPGDLGRVAAPGDPRGSASTGWMPKTQVHVLLLERTLVEFVSLKPFKHLAQQKAAQDRGCGSCSPAQVCVTHCFQPSSISLTSQPCLWPGLAQSSPVPDVLGQFFLPRST